MKYTTKKTIEKYCMMTNSEYYGYSGGIFTFENKFNGYKSFTKNDLIKFVSNNIH